MIELDSLSRPAADTRSSERAARRDDDADFAAELRRADDAAAPAQTDRQTQASRTESESEPNSANAEPDDAANSRSAAPPAANDAEATTAPSTDAPPDSSAASNALLLAQLLPESATPALPITPAQTDATPPNGTPTQTDATSAPVPLAAATPTLADTPQLAAPAELTGPSTKPVEANAEPSDQPVEGETSPQTPTPGAPRKAAANLESGPSPAPAPSAAAQTAAATRAELGAAPLATDAARLTPLQHASSALSGLADASAPTGDAGKSAAAFAASQPSTSTAASAVLQVQARMIERFDGRAQRFDVRLDPPELGRVDVRIEIGSDKRVHAVLAAHDSASLNDLMRGAKSLEQALNQAGINLAEDGLTFQLASDNQQSPQRDRAASDVAQRAALAGTTLLDLPVEADAALPLYAARAYALGRVNLVA